MSGHGLHDLGGYFAVDDGSLPEIELSFASLDLMPAAFSYLFERGAEDVTINGGQLWIRALGRALRFSGPEDAWLVSNESADPFHIVLGGIRGTSVPMPDLGVLVCREGLVLDYRMGPQWSPLAVDSLLELLRRFCAMGGVLTVPWWGKQGEGDFLAALSRD